MNLSIEEKNAAIFLSLLLFIGVSILGIRWNGGSHEIEIIENGVKEKMTLNEVEVYLIEKRKVSINKAPLERLITIPQVGEVLANRIIEYRKLNGPFRSISDLLNVKGIGESKLGKIEPFIKFE